MIPRGWISRLGVAVACVLGASLICSSAPAQAKVTRPLLSTFDGSTAPGGPFGFLFADAVDNSPGTNGGDVYVGEVNSSTFASDIDQFDASGTYTGLQITGADTPAGSFSLVSFSTFQNSGIAVDSSAGANQGDLYVADIGNNVVDKFDSAGNYVCQITGAGSATTSASECDSADAGAPAGSISPSGIAIDATGNVYVADAATNVIDVFGPSGGYIRQISDPNITSPGAIAVDSSGNLYVANVTSLFLGGTNVVKFDSGGSFVSVLDTNGPVSVSVDPTDDHVLVSETSPQEQIAEFDASGNPLLSFGSGEYAAEAVSATTGDVYAASFSSAGTGVVEIWGPPVVIPDVTTGSATDVQQTSATLNGHVDPDAADGGGDVTACQFEYGTDTSYGQTAPCSPAAPYSGATDVSADLATLTPDTTYHFRLDANNANGVVSHGQDQSFTTPGPPVIDSQSSTAGATSATVRAQINPFGLDTTCQVEYVDDASFQTSGYAAGTTLPCTPADLGSGFGDQTATAKLTGLTTDTTYHFRFIASNHADTVTGPDQTFATFGITSFSMSAVDQNGQPYTQAGGHPYELTTSFDLSTTSTATGDPATDANLKDAYTELPPGLIGNPTAAQKCTRDELANVECSGASQVGVLTLREAAGGDFEDEPLYNLVPPAGGPAEFGAKINSVLNVYIDANIRTGGDYGVSANVSNASAAVGVTGATVELWGVPADPSHDAQRVCAVTLPDGRPGQQSPCSAGQPLVPFLSNPTSCSGPQTATLRADSWQAPGDFVSASATMPALTGCDRLDFTPSLTVQPDTGSADSASGLHLDLGVPQNDNPDGLAEANLKKAVVTLPPGTTVNPAAADGLAACSPAEIGLDNASEPSCPDASKVGSVEVDTPLLSDPLKGSVYVAKQNQNPFGSLLAIYLTAEADGALVKLAGHVVADPQTGQLETTFDDNPQLPFSDFKLDFFGGSRGVLATPVTCGSFQTTSQMVPWSAADPNNPQPGEIASPSDSFTIGSGPNGTPCVSDPAQRPLAPGFSAGTISPQAGGFSPFVLKLTRQDGEQNLTRLDTTLPPGLLGKLAGIPECSDAALASISQAAGTGANEAQNPACPAGSQLGTTQVGAGAGTPFFVGGKVYLAGPYKGAPLSLAIVTPALAGPFDLGSIVVRAALYVDPSTAQITARSDAIPTIVHGIPLRIREIRIKLDRPNFTLNPTSCDPMAVTGTAFGSDGAQAALTDHYQASGCGALPFAPRFSASILNGSQGTHRSDHPNLVFNLHANPGDANVRMAQVLLPSSFQIDQANLGNICSETELANTRCAGRNTVGTATATTPLLDYQLSGPVYAVSGSGGLPKLAVILNGPPTQPVQLILRGVTTTVGNRIANTFATVPDAPVTDFNLSLNGGPGGYLVDNTDVCAGAKAKGKKARKKASKLRKTNLTADALVDGQNGKTADQSIPIAAQCPKAKKHKRSAKHRKHRKHDRRGSR